MMMRNAATVGDNFIPSGVFNLFINMNRILTQAAVIKRKVEVNTRSRVVRLCHAARYQRRVLNAPMVALSLHAKFHITTEIHHTVPWRGCFKTFRYNAILQKHVTKIGKESQTNQSINRSIDRSN